MHKLFCCNQSYKIIIRKPYIMIIYYKIYQAQVLNWDELEVIKLHRIMNRKSTVWFKDNHLCAYTLKCSQHFIYSTQLYLNCYFTQHSWSQVLTVLTYSTQRKTKKKIKTQYRHIEKKEQHQSTLSNNNTMNNNN